MSNHTSIYHFIDIGNPYTSSFLSDDDMLILLKNQVISGDLKYHSTILKSRNNEIITFHEAIDFKLNTDLQVDLNYCNYITHIHNIKTYEDSSSILKLTFLKLYSDLMKPLNDLKTLENILFHQMHIEVERTGRANQVFAPMKLESRHDEVEMSQEVDRDRYISVGLVIRNDRVLMVGRGLKKKGLVFPKGGCEKDEWPFSGVTALREVYEEGGCICEIVEQDVINNYDHSGKNHKFFVYKMNLIEYLQDYPEKEKRLNVRKWVLYEDALKNFEKMTLDAEKKSLYIDMLEYAFGRYDESRVRWGQRKKSGKTKTQQKSKKASKKN